MKTGRMILPFVVVAFAYYVPKLLFPGSTLFGVLTPTLHGTIGAYAKLACLVMGAIGGAECTRRLERDNPSRGPWMMLALWLADFAIGQTIFIAYPIVQGREAPVPSFADPAFVAGYAMMILATVRFTFVYRASGLPVGSAASHAKMGGAALAAFAVIGWFVLAPIARADAPLAQRVFDVGYPALDFLALAPTIVMIRIALAFRPGKIWTVWAALLVGFVFMAVGDILFAYVSTIGAKSVEPLVDLTLLLGYFFVACGTRMQRELLAS
jgi:hypothetical protein